MIPEGMFKSQGTGICLVHANFKSGEMFILETERCIMVISYAQKQLAGGGEHRAWLGVRGLACIPAQAVDTQLLFFPLQAPEFLFCCFFV